MDCKYYQQNDFCECKLASKLASRTVHIHCEGRKHNPCVKCKQENPNTSQDDPTPTVLHQIKLSQGVGVIQQVQNYTEAITGFVMGGFREVPDEVYQARLTTCRECPNYADNRCLLCGCKLEGESGFTSKLKMSHQKCPDIPPRWSEHVD